MFTVELAHVNKGLSRIIAQWQEKPVVRAIIEAILVQCQELEDVFQALIASRLLSSATGHALDMLGGLVGEPRKNHTDDTIYRNWIYARILVNVSYGDFDQLLRIIDQIEDGAYSAEEVFPAGLYYEFSEELTNPPSEVFQLLRQGKAGGVWLALVYMPEGEEDVFSCCEGTTPEASTTEGFGLTDFSTGGYLAGVYVT